MGWDAEQYLRFETERTRPAAELLARLERLREREVREVVDLGCGPGNSTALLTTCYPDAVVTGVDTSEEMLKRARETVPGARFVRADLAAWRPPPSTDVVFANAVFQWVPRALAHLRRIHEALPSGAILAIQMPDNLSEPTHRIITELAAEPQWSSLLGQSWSLRGALPSPEALYDTLFDVCATIDLWHTIYQHQVDDAAAVVDWVDGSALRPVLSALPAASHTEWRAAYSARIAAAYPARVDGRVLLRFPRLFMVAVRA